MTILIRNKEEINYITDFECMYIKEPSKDDNFYSLYVDTKNTGFYIYKNEDRKEVMKVFNYIADEIEYCYKIGKEKIYIDLNTFWIIGVNKMSQKEKLKIYLSGAISGKEKIEYQKEFYDAKEKILKWTENKDIPVEVIVPCDYDHLNKTGKWEDYLKTDIKLLADCDWLVDIENGSEKSKGVMLEKMICTALNINMIELSEFKLMYDTLLYNKYIEDSEKEKKNE